MGSPTRHDSYRRAFSDRALGFLRVAFVVLSAAVMAADADGLGITPLELLAISGVGLLFALVRVRWPRSSRRWVPVEYLDFVLAFAFISQTGGTSSPLLPGLLIFVAGVTLRYGPPAAFLGSAMSIAGLVALRILPTGPGILDPTVALVGLGGTMILAGISLAALGEVERRLRESAQESAVTDPLTGLLNRRYLRVRIEREIARRRRYGGTFTLLRMSVRDLAYVNDQHGYAAGDKYLRHIAKTLKECVRSGEDLARYAGDQFMLLMPGANRWDAEEAAARISRRLREEPLRDGNLQFPVRVNIGIAEYPLHGRSCDEILRAFDRVPPRSEVRRDSSAG